MQNNDYFSSFSKKTGSENYCSVPDDYQRGKTKYIVLFGTVISGLGKGVVGSALASLLKLRGIKTTMMKFDGYLNQDAGTLNPYRHGEVFVLDDGTECDMDLGTYERFFDETFSKSNYLTAGKLFHYILDKERNGGYLGRDVQFIPHVTGEIKSFVRNLAFQTKSNIVFIEVGGTVGDIESSYFIEAMRELKNEEGPDNVLFVVLTYILKPKKLMEQKSKAAQLGLRTLMSLGIHPDFVVCRCDEPISESVKQKIGLSSNVPVENVISAHDVDSVYMLPDLLKEQKFDEKVIEHLGVTAKEIDYKWKNFLDSYANPKKEITIAITGKYTALRDSYASILCALDHCRAKCNTQINIKWIETTDIEDGKTSVESELKDVDAVIIPGGFGARGFEGKVTCAKYARENNIPYLGLCLGFQVALVEYARNVCGIKDANSTEINPNTKDPIVFLLPQKEEKIGGTLRLGGKDVLVKNGTFAHALYGSTMIRERFRHRYECNAAYINAVEKNGLVFSGMTPEKDIMQILEIPNHKYFIATQYHAEYTSRPFAPSPVFVGLVETALKK